MLAQFFSLTLKGLRHRPTRSWLTVLGVVIGIMLVVIILSLGSGIQNTITKQMAQFGSELIIIYPGKSTNPLAGLVGNTKFKYQDITNLSDINGVEFVVPMNVAALNTEFQGEKQSVMIHAAPWKEMSAVLEKSQGAKLSSGRWPTSDQAREVVLGHLVANDTYQNPVRLGDHMTIKSKRMEIVGTISEIGNQMDDNVVWVSFDMFRDLTGLNGGVASAMVQVKTGHDVEYVSQQVKFELSKQEAVQDFSVITPAKASDLVGGILTIVELGLIAIALIALLVGAVGIMNTMYTSVLERTKQIGILKAIGATEDAIMSLFLIEAGMIGLVGGIFGVLLGIGVAALIGVAASYGGVPGMFSFASLDYLGFLAVLLVTFIIGVLSGVLPARQAAKMEPAEALRYE
jgi:putative ABC transport system permease protein